MTTIENSSWKPINEIDVQPFCVEMMKRLDIQRKREHFCDVILEVANGDVHARLKAHSIILCAASPFFYSALHSNMKESKEGVIRLEDASKDLVEELLKYLYTGHIDVTQHNAYELLKLADFLVIPSLKEASGRFIIQNLSSVNCLMAYYFAVKYHCNKLQYKTRDFIFANFMRVVEQEDFLNLSMKEVEEWISSDEIRVRGEENIFQAIVKWAEAKDCGEREKFFELFRHVRLVYLSRSYVFSEILAHPFVSDDKMCTAFLLDAMKDVSSGSEECFFAQAPRNCLKTTEDCLVVTGKCKTLCYLPSENKWYEMADKTKSKHLSSMSASYGKLYANNGPDVAHTIERFDPAINVWAPVMSFKGQMSRVYAAVVNFQGFLYVIGGKKGKEAVNSVHKYNPDANLWQEVAPMNTSRYRVCAIADKDNLYAVGGCVENQVLNVVERFDAKRNLWSTVAPTLEGRACPHSIILNGKVFLFGGYTSLETPFSASSVIEMYDPVSNIWTAIQSTSAPKRCYGATSFKGNVFVTGLWDQETSNNYSLGIYDVKKNEWFLCASLPLRLTPIDLAPVRIPRDILDTCKVFTQE